MIGLLRWRVHGQKTLERTNLFATGVPLKSGKFGAFATNPTSLPNLTDERGRRTAESSNPRACIDVTNVSIEIGAKRILREHLSKHRFGHIVILVDAGVMKLDLQSSGSRIITDRPLTR